MGIDGKQSQRGGITLKQIGSVLVAFALCFIAIYWNALTIGYIVVTLALSAFLLIVAFDYGLDKSRPAVSSDENEGASAGAPDARPTRRGGRNARTA